jgi:hypothetical protein
VTGTANKDLFVDGLHSAMNKHFEDARYYLKRAGETAAAGLSEEIESYRDRVMAALGREDEAVPVSRLDELRAELNGLVDRAEGEAREALEDARDRLDGYRAERTAPEQ